VRKRGLSHPLMGGGARVIEAIHDYSQSWPSPVSRPQGCWRHQ
jgi:hypothetical protein